MRLLHTVEIPPNPMGLVALSINSDNNYLAYPSPQKVTKLNGSNTMTNGPGIDVTGINGQHPSASNASHLPNNGANSQDDLAGLHDTSVTQSIRNGDVIIFDCKSLQPITVIDAHKTQLSTMAFSQDGTLLATASDKGTIVRVFSVERGVKLYQFRRGTYNTKIYSLAFSPSNMFLVASSATGTVHVFRLGEEEAKNTVVKSSRSSGWLNQRKNENDRSLEVTRQNELDRLMKNRQAKMEAIEDFELTNEEDQTEVDAADFQRLGIHSDSEDDIDSLDDDDENNEEEAEEEEEEAEEDGGHELEVDNVAGDIADGENVERTDEDFENVDVLRPLQSELGNNTQYGAISIFSSSSGGSASGKAQPIVDSNRRSVARMFRRTSQSLGRKAAEKMGTYLPPRFSSILEPNRHFASFKVPTSKENMSIVGVIELNVDSSIDANDELSIQSHAGHTLHDDSSSTHSLNSGVSGLSTGSRGNSRSNSRFSKKKAVHILVVSADGIFYTYGLNPERGGDCVLLMQRSLIE
ncbi:hypothetical protein PMKS-000407 [Pichia membranifaciens]|uniref:Uncharacterized protein n=1 Tax=Pichia membranifaciens TaxID=4926 RepID=A0A1Q2YBL4_9ASCO|nr:hypothetical protein PMKS-000407 [Pichia membranifaciens]